MLRSHVLIQNFLLQKKSYNLKEKLEDENHLTLPQKNQKKFNKHKQCADMRIGEISHVLDYRSQQVESTFHFDTQVSVTSAGAPEPQSTISIAAEYKIRSSILK